MMTLALVQFKRTRGISHCSSKSETTAYQHNYMHNWALASPQRKTAWVIIYTRAQFRLGIGTKIVKLVVNFECNLISYLNIKNSDKPVRVKIYGPLLKRPLMKLIGHHGSKKKPLIFKNGNVSSIVCYAANWKPLLKVFFSNNLVLYFGAAI